MDNNRFYAGLMRIATLNRGINKPIKLKSVEAANNISAFIQHLCKKPDYNSLNQLFLIDNYKWRSLDPKHRKKVEDKINEVYPEIGNSK